MIILHGDNIVASREKLTSHLSNLKEQGKKVVRFDAKPLSRAELESALGESDLFGTQKGIVIEALHSLPTSARKKELLSLLEQETPHEVILWEKRALTPTMLKKFPQAQASEFKTSNALFAWLDLFGSQGNPQKKLSLLHEAILKDGEYLCFLMLVRHIRLLLLAKTGGTIKGPPFMVSKYKKQAHNFTETQLIHLHTKLVELDEKAKTSRLALPLQSQLDLFTLGV